MNKFNICQRFDKGRLKYGKMPPKEADVFPWGELNKDVIGSYTLHREGN